MNRETRRITDGAMMAAIIGVMLIVNRQTAGIIEVTFEWALPLPMVFYAAKYGYKNSLLLFISVILLTWILGTPQTLFYIISAMLIGIVYGGGIKERVAGRKLVIRTIVISVISTVLSTLVFASFFGYDLAGEFAQYRVWMEKGASLFGVSVSESQIEEFLKTILVVSVLTMGVLNGYITHLLSRLMLKRLRIYVEPITPIASYYPPKWSGYVGIACMFMAYIPNYVNLDNEILSSLCIGLGYTGYLYLVVYGMIAIALFLRLEYDMKGFGGILAFAVGVILSIVTAMIGYLYITTDIHEELMKGGNIHASKNS